MSDISEIIDNLQKGLTNLAASNNMSLGEMSQLISMLQERERILSQHKIPISQNQTDLRWRTRLPNGKQIVKTRKEDLEDAIIAYHKGFESTKPIVEQSTMYSSSADCTLTKIYPQWLKLRRLEVCQNTLADDVRNWNMYIANSEIADIPLRELSKVRLKVWANRLITEHSMKRKYFNNVKTVINSLLDFAVDEEYIDVNKLRGIKINKHLYKPATQKEQNEEVFTEQEQELVMKEAELDSQDKQSAIPLGICLLFLTGLRVGELCALRFCDIKGDYLYINRMVVEKQMETPDGFKSNGYEIVEHAKSTAGRRAVYLTNKAKVYLDQIKELNTRNGFSVSSNSLIFQRKDGLCNQRVFDSRLKKYCKPSHLNLPFAKSCHDIRRSYISHLFDLGINPDEIRRIAGHENIEMTMKYCRGRKSQDELAELLERNF